jgi:hypothetical protein
MSEVIEHCPDPAQESIVGTPRGEVKITPEQMIAVLEGQLLTHTESIDALRAKLAKALNGKTYERLLSEELANSRLREALLEAQIAVFEEAYVEHMVQHRRSE